MMEYQDIITACGPSSKNQTEDSCFVTLTTHTL